MEQQAKVWLAAGYTVDQLTRWQKADGEEGICPKTHLEDATLLKELRGVRVEMTGQAVTVTSGTVAEPDTVQGEQSASPAEHKWTPGRKWL